MRCAATLTVVLLGTVACGGSKRVPETLTAPTSSEQPSSPAPQAAVEGDAAAAAIEPTCEEGDQPLGPNCVHEEWLPVGGMNRPFSTVYRLVDGKKVVVWDDQGHVTESTATHLVVVQATMVEGEGMRDIAVKCPWSAARYAAQCEQTEPQSDSR